MESLDDLPFTGERFIPMQMANDRLSQKIRDLHFRSYEIATHYVRGKRILDIACGTGYGSQMLAERGASTVIGVDICARTVQYARKHYQTLGVEFVCADALHFEWSEQFDVVVSFETIEHLHNPTQFLDRVRCLLVPGGVFLLSVPLGETRHITPHHRQAFTQQEVYDLLEKAGFSVELQSNYNFSITRSDALEWRRTYSTAGTSIRELCLTRRGWQLIYNFVFQGGLTIPHLVLSARSLF